MKDTWTNQEILLDESGREYIESLWGREYLATREEERPKAAPDPKEEARPDSSWYF